LSSGDFSKPQKARGVWSVRLFVRRDGFISGGFFFK